MLRLDNSGAVKWANTYAIGYSDFETEPRVADDGSILIHFVTIPDFANKPLIKIGPNGITNWAMSIEGASASLADFNVGSLPYRFIEPYLFVTGGRLASTKLFSFVFAINYQTGKIEKQVKFTSPGGIGFIEKTANSLYVSLLNQAMQAMSARLVCQAALLRFDFDLNLRAARSIRNAEPHWPIVQALPSGKLLFSYSYNARKTLVAETVNDNFESTNSCDVLQKADFSVTKSNFEARSISVVTTPLPPITVSDANSKTSEADLAPVPLDLKAVPCKAQPQ
jgi:hypothetical protein